MKMLNFNPVRPMKGPGYARHSLDGRIKENKERLLLVKQFLPRHYIFTSNKHYVSPEAFSASIDTLRSHKDQRRFVNAIKGVKMRITKKLHSVIKDVNSL